MDESRWQPIDQAPKTPQIALVSVKGLYRGEPGCGRIFRVNNWKGIMYLWLLLKNPRWKVLEMHEQRMTRTHMNAAMENAKRLA